MQRLSRWARTFLILVIPSLSQAQPSDWQAQVEQEAAQLDRLHTLLVAHQGEEILALDLRGQGLDTPVNIKSLSKTVLAALVGMGIKKEVFEGTDQQIGRASCRERV